MERGGIWLTDNWYDPEIANGNRAWWCGPKRVSEVKVWRANGERFLKFFVKGVNGITYRDIEAKVEGDRRMAARRPRRSPRRRWNALHNRFGQLARERHDYHSLTPECYPSIVTTKEDTSLVRQSFIATDWN